MASILKVDDLRGNASAGDITITSEGGSATQSLQQGLAKCWIHIGAGGSSIGDSINVGSLVDAGTGDYTINYSNNMSSANVSATALIVKDHTSNSNNLRNLVGEGKDSSNFEVNACYINASGLFISYDIETNGSVTVHGDLA